MSKTPSISGFDFFDDVEDSPETEQSRALEALTRLWRGPAQILPTRNLFKSGPSVDSAYFRFNVGWAVLYEGPNPEAYGKRLQKNLKPVSKLRADEQGLGRLPLYVQDGESWVKIPPVPQKGEKVGSMRSPTYSVQIVPAPVRLRGKTAGEVRFIKDKDSGQWAFNENNQSERQIRLLNDYTFNPKNVKPLVCALRSTLMALGHAMSAYTKFSKIKSTTISPDGMLGGKGYILKIKDMRSMYMNAVEAMSSLTDTLYDEVKAEHWKAITQYLPPEAQKDVEEVMDDVDAIKDNPEAYADAETKELDKEGLPDGVGKVASQIHRSPKSATWVTVKDHTGDPVWTGPMTNLLLRMGGDLNPVLALRPGRVAHLRRNQVRDLVLDSSALRVATAALKR